MISLVSIFRVVCLHLLCRVTGFTRYTLSSYGSLKKNVISIVFATNM